MNIARSIASRIMPRGQAYEGASTGRRMARLHASEEGPNALVFRDLDILRARSHQLVRNNAWAASAITRWVSNVIGTGIPPMSLHPDPAIRKGIEAAFLRWCDEADSAGQVDFYGFQQLVCRSAVEGGECFVRFRDRRPEDGLSVPLQLQLMEAEQVPTSHNVQGKGKNAVRAGIEFDALNRRVAYHMYRQHPNDGVLLSDAKDLSRVSADEVAHVYQISRPGQYRGVPKLATALVKLYALDKYDDAELQRMENTAMFVGFYVQPDASDAAFPESQAGLTAPAGVQYSDLEGGTMQALKPGEDVKFTDPPAVAGTYLEFESQQLRAIAVALDMTYEILTGDLTKVNYSSIRSGTIEVRRIWEQYQWNTIIYQLCRPIWRRWIDAAVLAGAFPAPGFFRNREAYYAVDWRPPKWDWVDPLKDGLAEKLALRCRLKSRRQSIRDRGYDIEEVDRQIAEDDERARRMGIVSDADPGQTADNGAAAQAEGAPDEPPPGQTQRQIERAVIEETILEAIQ